MEDQQDPNALVRTADRTLQRNTGPGEDIASAQPAWNAVLMSFAAMALALALGQTTQPSTFPDLLLGQWTQDLAACGGEDTEGVSIEPDKVQFYEAVGRVQAITVDANGAVTSDLRFSGEGRSWTETAHFRLSHDQTSVEVRALGQKLVLTRCPVVLNL